MLSAQEAVDVAAAAGGEDLAGDEDRRLLIRGVTWGRYVAIRELLDDHPGLRMTYLEGKLELMSPSLLHETIKKVLASLIELYLLERDIERIGAGSTTFREEAKKRGLEPDECYMLGAEEKPVPDIAIEVALSSGGIDKLEVYRGLGVPEVWIWQGERLVVYCLGEGGYAARERSALLPDLDLALLAECARIKGQTAAVRAFRDRLRATSR